MLKLTGLTLEGFMSFSAPFSDEKLPGLPGRGRMTNRLALGDVTVLIGPNGAGKSNIVSLFQMLSAMLTGKFQEYVARAGFANSILHYGAKRTPESRVSLEFEDNESDITAHYRFRLAAAATDTLVFADETPECHGETARRLRGDLAERSRQRNQLNRFPTWYEQSAGAAAAERRESRLTESSRNGDADSLLIAEALRGCRCYYFGDTASNAKIRQSCYIEDNSQLLLDGSNLAAFLYGLKVRADTEPYFRRIENSVRLAFPQLERFVLEPRFTNERYIQLNWLSRSDDGYLLGPHQLSDGALRFAALTALLLEPPDMLPSFIILDEPELGLHPGAIELLAEMIKGVALQKQVLVATQSPQLVNYFDLSQIRPIEHRGGRSVILELDPEAYKDWLDEYSTGELWEKNIIGGGPTGA